MAQVFVFVEDEIGRQTGRGVSFVAVLRYVLRDAGPEDWRGSFGLMLPLDRVAGEMDHTYEAMHLVSTRRGPKTRRPVLHAVLGWHPDDLEWLTRDHLATSVSNALRHLGLAEHQAVYDKHIAPLIGRLVDQHKINAQIYSAAD